MGGDGEVRILRIFVLLLHDCAIAQSEGRGWYETKVWEGGCEEMVRGGGEMGRSGQ